MNKDTVVASVIGFGLGLVAAIALWVVPRILPKTTPKPQATEQVANAEKTDTISFDSFDIAHPKDGEIAKNKTITLEGTTSDAKYVVITSISDNLVLTPDSDGSFSTSLNLNEGANEIVVTSMRSTDEETKTIFVYHFADSI